MTTMTIILVCIAIIAVLIIALRNIIHKNMELEAEVGKLKKMGAVLNENAKIAVSNVSTDDAYAGLRED